MENILIYFQTEYSTTNTGRDTANSNTVNSKVPLNSKFG